MPIQTLIDPRRARPGFTLAEMILALFIFSFMSASLATIYATANRHMFQNYRRNTIKTNADFAMHTIQHVLSQATRIDQPAYTKSGNRLSVADNVDQLTGCYPVKSGVAANWHVFCTAADSQDGTVTDLYYHTGQITAGGGNPCGSVSPSYWTANSYPVPACGVSGGGGQTVTILMQYVATPGNRSGAIFSREQQDGVDQRDAVAVNLRSFWQASVRHFGAKQRQQDIDFSLSSLVQLSRPAMTSIANE